MTFEERVKRALAEHVWANLWLTQQLEDAQAKLQAVTLLKPHAEGDTEGNISRFPAVS